MVTARSATSRASASPVPRIGAMTLIATTMATVAITSGLHGDTGPTVLAASPPPAGRLLCREPPSPGPPRDGPGPPCDGPGPPCDGPGPPCDSPGPPCDSAAGSAACPGAATPAGAWPAKPPPARARPAPAGPALPAPPANPARPAGG